MDTAADKRKRLFSYETDILVETTYVDVVKPLPEGSIGMKSRNSGWDEGKDRVIVIWIITTIWVVKKIIIT